MTSAKDFTARFRTSHEAWEQLGARIGDRHRSAELDAFLNWRLANADAELPTAADKPTRVHQFFVRVTVADPYDPKVEVVELPGSEHTLYDPEELAEAIATYLASKVTPRRPRRLRRAGAQPD